MTRAGNFSTKFRTLASPHVRKCKTVRVGVGAEFTKLTSALERTFFANAARVGETSPNMARQILRDQRKHRRKYVY